MTDILKLTVNTIQRKLSLGSVKKMKEIIFKTKQNEGYHQESSSNKSRKTKKSKTDEI